jgi:hypothetical protein
VLLPFSWVISGSGAGAGRVGLLNLLCSLVHGLLRIGIRGLDSFAAARGVLRGRGAAAAAILMLIGGRLVGGG